MDAVVFWWEALKHLRKEICFSYWAWFNDMEVFIIENMRIHSRIEDICLFVYFILFYVEIVWILNWDSTLIQQQKIKKKV